MDRIEILNIGLKVERLLKSNLTDFGIGVTKDFFNGSGKIPLCKESLMMSSVVLNVAFITGKDEKQKIFYYYFLEIYK